MIKHNTNLIRIPTMMKTQTVGVKVNKDGELTGYKLNQHTHRVYSSSAAINSYRNSGDIDSQIEITRLILNAEYLGCLGMACLLREGRDRVECHLTPLQGLKPTRWRSISQPNIRYLRGYSKWLTTF